MKLFLKFAPSYSMGHTGLVRTSSILSVSESCDFTLPTA